ncbi:ABC transporter substrate-binding protein [Vibrio sp. RC27]
MQKYLTFATALISTILLAGCDQQNIDHSKIRETGFVYCGQGKPTTFNPQLVDGGVTVDALSPQLFDTLLTLNNSTHLPQPNLAHSWHVSNDGLVYQFELRSDIEFQTTSWFTPTRPLSADDIRFSFERILLSSNPFHTVGNSAYPWFRGNNFQQLVKSIETPNSHTVKFHLNHADNTFLSLLSTPYAVIHSQEYAEQLIERNEKSLIDSQPVGTGPFLLDEYLVGDYVRLKRHDDYWNGRAKMEQVVFDIEQRGTGSLAKLLLNECDVLNSSISSQIPVIQDQSHISLLSSLAMNTAYIAVNTKRQAMNDQRVRRALSYAIDRQKIIDSVYYGRGSIAYNILPPVSWAYSKNTTQIRYDRRFALGLLKDAGYVDGLTLTMSVPTESTSYNPSPQKSAALIQSYFSDIGIRLKLVPQSVSRDNQVQFDNNVDLYLTGIVGRSANPDGFLRPVLSCQSHNQGADLTHWCNDSFDSLLNLALEINAPRFRLNLYKQIQNIINQNVPVIPIAHGRQFKAYNNSLTGFAVNPFHVQPFNHVERLK